MKKNLENPLADTRKLTDEELGMVAGGKAKCRPLCCEGYGEDE